MNIPKIGGHNPYDMATKNTEKRDNIQANKTTLQVKQDNDESGMVISISNAGRMRQQSRLPTLTVDDSVFNSVSTAERKAAISGKELVTRDNFVEFTDQSLMVDISNIPAASPQETYYRALFNAKSGNSESDFAGTLGSKASKYMELRKGIEEKYSGEELTEHLKWLDDSYDKVINDMSDVEAMIIRGRAKTYEFFARVNNDLVRHGEKSGSIIEYDKETFSKSVDSLAKNMMDAFKHYGALAKQYMLDGNAAIVTKEDNNSFVVYLAQNTDATKGIYSLDDLDMVKMIFNSYYSNTEDALHSALEKLQDSGLSNDVKVAVIRVAMRSDL